MMTFVCTLISTGGSAQENWELKKEEDGIKVFTGISNNSAFKSVKVECTINASQSQLVAFLLDIEKQHEWIYNNKSSKFIAKVSDNERIFYSEVNVPWPCNNRDYIAHFSINQASLQHMSIDSHADPDLLPEKKGLVRVRSSVAHWDVTTLSANLLRIVYTVQIDPGGTVPAWLINLFVAKGPLHTFQKLREGVRSPAYQNARLDFIRQQ
jgi:hypothetical protein